MAITPQEYTSSVMELVSPICDTDQVSVDINTITSLCKVAAIFDLQKRQMFYAKKPLQRRLTDDMVRIDGITAAARLALKNERLLGKTYAECGVDPDLIHACIGLATEIGEIWEELLRAMADGGTVNLDNLQEELGDLAFYQAFAGAVAERMDDNRGRFTPEGIQVCNIAKLHTRYPDKAASVVANSGGERNRSAENQAMAAATPRHGTQPANQILN